MCGQPINVLVLRHFYWSVFVNKELLFWLSSKALLTYYFLKYNRFVSRQWLPFLWERNWTHTLTTSGQYTRQAGWLAGRQEDETGVDFEIFKSFTFSQIKCKLRHVLSCVKFSCLFPCLSLLLSTSMLNDICVYVHRYGWYIHIIICMHVYNIMHV